LSIDATIGHTSVQATGTVTSLTKMAALDMRLKLRGDNLEQLFPLLGIAVPATGAYVTEGHLLHDGKVWRYEEFSGLMGTTDIAGSLQLSAGIGRPLISGNVVSKRLDLADLAPAIGARPGGLQAVKPAPSTMSAHLLPDLPFKFERWNSIDAEVDLSAKTIQRAKELPLENLLVHLSLRDSVLTLDPLNFDLAGGQLKGLISLDGRGALILAQARIKARRILLDKLFPSMALGKTGIGEVNGAINLAGRGNSVARMLANAKGEAALVVVGGKVSKLMMEKAGLHLWEILQLELGGDSLVKLRCAVADFDVMNGKMQAQALIFDTQITTLIGTGSIDLAKERLDLVFHQKTKDTSPVALRSPLYVRGSFAKPEIGVDASGLAFRALGAIALGVVNPLLALIPLIDAGPGQDSDCRGLIREARIKN
jgi:AsmA protein